MKRNKRRGQETIRHLYVQIIDGLECLYAALDQADTPEARSVMTEVDADILAYSSYLAQHEVSVLHPDNPFVAE